MKITNICISAPYIEKYSYQENIITDYFVYNGIETTIIGSNILPSYLKSEKIEPGIYSDKGKKLIRLKCFKISNQFIIPIGLYKHLKNDNSDVIFHHNLNCTSLIICSLYRIRHPNCVLLVDNHADFINGSKNKLWQFFYNKICMRLAVKFISNYVRKFYGVTPSRCEYLHKVYGIKKSKIDFLPIGSDVKTSDSITENKLELREKFSVKKEAFVFVSGGKMGIDKGTNNLIKAINAINEIQIDSTEIFLILFGSFSDKETEKLAKESDFVIIKKWCDHKTSLRLLKLADVAVWPIHHTTLIEDAISVNIPLLIRKTTTTEHLIDGNGIFLDSAEYEELFTKMKYFRDSFLINNYEDRCKAMREKLSYDSIIKKVLNDIC